MQQIETIEAMRAAVKTLRAEGKTVALVPTLGALHAGHASLVRRAKEVAGAAVLSIFVNPLQFGTHEDMGKYPRTLPADLLLADKETADVVFTPHGDELFPKGFSVQVIEERISKTLCGVSRPALFKGVLTTWVKLLNIVQPDFLIMGEKDAQQIAVMRKALRDLAVPVEIVTAPIVRDADGLALNSRNIYLSPAQREEARAIPQALRRAREMVESGVKSADRIVAEATHILGQKRRLRVIYIALVNRDTMDTLREVVPGQSLLAISAWADEVRLTDNVYL